MDEVESQLPCYTRGWIESLVAHEVSRYRAGLKCPLSEIHPRIPPSLGKRGKPCLNGPQWALQLFNPQQFRK